MSATAWTDAERASLLASIIESAGTIDWKKVTLPESRTEKACRHVIEKIRKEAKDATADGEASPKTPKKATPKRKSTGKGVDEGVDMNDEKEVTPTPSPKRQKKAAAAKKSEDADEDVKEEDVKEESVKEELADEVEA